MCERVEHLARDEGAGARRLMICAGRQQAGGDEASSRGRVVFVAARAEPRQVLAGAFRVRERHEDRAGERDERQRDLVDLCAELPERLGCLHDRGARLAIGVGSGRELVHDADAKPPDTIAQRR